MKTPLSDNELMLLFAHQNDEIAFERLYHKYKVPLLRFSMGYTLNATIAEEIVHETFLKVYRFKNSYDPEKPFRTWLWTICKNTNLDAYDKRSKHKMQELDLNDELPNIESDDALEKLIEDADKKEIESAIASLPISQREAILIWMNDEMSFDEMGEIFNKSGQAVKNLVHRAKIGIKEKLGKRP